LEPERAWIIAVLRGEIPPWPGSAEPCSFADQVFRRAEQEGALPLLYHCLRGNQQAIPPALRDRLARRARQEAAADLPREQALRDALAALAGAGTPVLLMKGTPLAYSHYPSPWLRPRCDSDLLLPDRAQAERAWGRLRGLGYQRPRGVSGELASTQYSCALPVKGGGFVLDIHWRLNNHQRFARAFGFEELARAAVAVPALGPPARALGPSHALLLAALHRIGHAAEGGADRLIWIYDLHLLARGLAADQWDELVALAADRGLAKVTLDGLRRSSALFGTALPAGPMEGLQAAAAGEAISLAAFYGRWRLELENWRALGGLRERAGFLREHLFPSADYLLHRYGRRSRLWLPWLYLHRTLRGVWKRLG